MTESMDEEIKQQIIDAISETAIEMETTLNVTPRQKEMAVMISYALNKIVNKLNAQG